jgi:glycosyltransferase involved in cell wall biosynthesis
MLSVTAIIPVWNEAEVIGLVLDEVPQDIVDRVIVVDGGSIDGTPNIAARRGADVVRQRQRGYGAACDEGARAAGFGVLVFFDGDYSDPPAEVSRLVTPILRGEADLVLGCRGRGGSGHAVPLHARLGNRLVTESIRLMTGRRVRDLPSYKAIRADRLAMLGMREKTYGWTTELVTKAIRAGLVIQEVDIGYRPRAGGRSKVSGTIVGSIRASISLALTVVRCSGWHVARDG